MTDTGKKSFDWKKIAGVFRAQSANDLNSFLEKVPQQAGRPVMIAACVAWGFAAVSGLYMAVQVQQMVEMRQELTDAKSLNTYLPAIKTEPVSKEEVQRFVETARRVYQEIDMRADGANIVITAPSVRHFTAFREAIGHVQNGGNRWHVTMDKLCVGKSCDEHTHLAAVLQVQKVSVEKPRQ